MKTVRLLLILLAAAQLTSPVASARRSRVDGRGPWLLTALPGMGTLSWGCRAGWSGYRTYELRFRAAASSATERVTMVAGGHVLLTRVINPGAVVSFPRSDSWRRQVTVTQSTEPGTLRARVTIDFRPGRVSPSHCWPWFPPAMTVDLYPR